MHSIKIKICTRPAKLQFDSDYHDGIRIGWKDFQILKIRRGPAALKWIAHPIFRLLFQTSVARTVLNHWVSGAALQGVELSTPIPGALCSFVC